MATFVNGAAHFAYGRNQQQAVLGLIAHDRQLRFAVPMLTRSAESKTEGGEARSRSSAAGPTRLAWCLCCRLHTGPS